MITVTELFGPQNKDRVREIIPSLPLETKENITCLFQKLNVLRYAFGKPMIITSGFRTMDQHLSIYKNKNASRHAEGLAPLSPPPKSLHLFGAACDVYDEKDELKKFILEHLELVEQTGLWMEEFAATPNWVHFQIYPPASLKRFFKP